MSLQACIILPGGILISHLMYVRFRVLEELVGNICIFLKWCHDCLYLATCISIHRRNYKYKLNKVEYSRKQNQHDFKADISLSVVRFALDI